MSDFSEGDLVDITIRGTVESRDLLSRHFVLRLLDGQTKVALRTNQIVGVNMIRPKVTPVGSVAVRHTEGVGFAVYVQSPEGPLCVWSADMLNGPTPSPHRVKGASVHEYGTVAYEPQG